MLSEMLESDVIEDKECREEALSTLRSTTGKYSPFITPGKLYILRSPMFPFGRLACVMSCI